MKSVIEVTSLCDLSGYSDAISKVGFNKHTGALYVVWRRSPNRVYVYSGLTTEDYNKACQIDVWSVRSNVTNIVSRARSANRVDDGELVLVSPEPAKTDTAPTFTVSLEVSGTFSVTIDASDFAEAAKKVEKVFADSLVNGTIDVKAVTKN